LNSQVYAQLVCCINELHHGDWQFIQLRGEPFGPSLIDGDDVDLLGTTQSVRNLLEQVFQWVRQGRCHVRVKNRKRDKTELTLLSMDGQHEAKFDLWMSIGQVDRGRRRVTFEMCQHDRIDPQATIGRVSVELEAALFVHHLICKRKDLRSEKNQLRSRLYVTALESESHFAFANALQIAMETGQIDSELEEFTLHIIQRQLVPDPTPAVSSWQRSVDQMRGLLLGPPRRLTAVVVMGCDGAGKTTLANRLAAADQKQLRTFTGKHLYRKSLLYKLAVIFLRPLTWQPREQFDETLAPLIYLRACAALRWKFSGQQPQLTIIDRSILDFLYVGRKTDSPRFCRGRWLSQLFGQRIPTIHCIVDHQEVVKRKQEVTPAGHHKYDQEMFLQFATQCPTDYVAFNNDCELEQSVQTLQRTLDKLRAA
jgi:hypothetical protein